MMKRNRWSLIGACAALLTAFSLVAKEPAPSKPLIVLQVLGEMPARDIEAAKAGILALYDVEVKVTESMNLPESAWYKPRVRYKADKLLAFLESAAREDCLKIVGLTSKDISINKDALADWGIFGLANLGGKTCVVSTFRLRAGDASTAKMHERLVKVVNHEIGHTFGLEHCPEKQCTMQDAKGKMKTVDEESGSFCKKCSAILGASLKQKLIF